MTTAAPAEADARETQLKTAYAQAFLKKLASHGIVPQTDADFTGLVELAGKTRKIAAALEARRSKTVSELTKTANASLDKILGTDATIDALVTLSAERPGKGKGGKTAGKGK